MNNPTILNTVLTIAGSDSSGGAGIQADLKTMLAHGVYGMSAITALTAQNTTGVAAIAKTDSKILSAQIDSVFEDIFPDAVKVGMVFSADLAGIIAERLRGMIADKDGACIPDFRHQKERIARYELKVFRGDLVDSTDGFFHIVSNKDSAEVVQ